MTPEEVAFVELLTKVLTLQLGPPVTVAIALDYYKDPSSHEDPQQWQNTRVGDLVHEGKYGANDAAGRQLATELSQFMDRHPDLRHAEVIVSIPSHSERHFSERLAAAIGRLRGVPVVKLADDVAAPIKNIDPDDRPAPSYSIDTEAIKGKGVVIIDDVTRKGESLRSAAQYVKAVGAREVSALVAVRTMRN